MSNKQDQKNHDKEAKLAAKKALKEKQARAKSSKAKKSKSDNVFVSVGKAIKRFFKDFRGTVKKIIWPDGKTVFKSSLVVLAAVLVVGTGIWISDFALSQSVSLVKNAAESLNSETKTEAEETTEEKIKKDEKETEKVTEEDPSEEIESDDEAETEGLDS